MNRGRIAATRSLRLGTTLVLAFSVGRGLPAWGDEPTPSVTSPARAITRVLDALPKRAVGGSGCTVSTDCDDLNACTVDECVAELCTHARIPGCVPCEVGMNCPPIDVVFIIDTSGSMKDEAAALCSSIDDLMTLFADAGTQVRSTILGITDAPASTFSCITDNVVNLLGGQVPGNAQSCPFPDSPSAFESWGPATAIVADRFNWLPGARRMIVPISDEGPCNGNRPDGCNDPGNDRDSIENIIPFALANRITISPITGTGADGCVTGLAGLLATGTFGTTHTTQNAGSQMAGMISDILLAACEPDPSCDDGDFCTCGDVCVDGVCRGSVINGCKPCNVTGVCDDGNACTDERCVGTQCVITPTFDPDVFVCDPQTGLLTRIDDLDDGNPCTRLVVDECTGDAVNVPVADRTPCDDGLFCTVGEVCLTGVCQGGVEPFCGDLDGPCSAGVCDENLARCVAQPINEGEPCDDGNVCNVGETCQGGSCTGGGPPACPDTGNDCTGLVCDTNGTEGNCDLLRRANDGDACDDGNLCTVGESCQQGECVGGETLLCDDRNECTDDACDPATGCVNTFNSNPCDDGDACTTGDVCVQGECQPGAPVVCNDDNECTDDSCDPVAGCQHTNNSNTCDDGNACTDGDVCTDGVCAPGPALGCDDGNVCTNDTCDVTRGCVHEFNNDPCSDGNACTERDMCVDGVCVGDTAVCDDANECTDDICNPTIGCTHVNNSNPCDDNDACTDGDVCTDGRCLPGNPIDCDDGNGCTNDSCDPIAGCRHEFTLDPCDDGSVCTLNETCSQGECVANEFLDCDDGNVCTDDDCDPESGCLHGFNMNPCDDADGCTVFDACNGAGQCVGTDINTLPCQSDDDCFGAICNAPTGLCVCNEKPELCLETVPGRLGNTGCYGEGEEILVNVMLRPSTQFVSGGQFLVDYDPTLLDFISIAPGDDIDPLSPFSMPIGSPFVDEVAGRIFYAVGIQLSTGVSTRGPAAMATLRFASIGGACATVDAFCLISENPMNTLLVGDDGQAVDFITCCTDPIVTNAAPPQLNCPQGVEVNADAGGVSALVTWDPVVAGGGCGGSIGLNCSGTNDLGAPVDSLSTSGGFLPPGFTEFTCKATDSCGQSTTCSWSVFVRPTNTLEVSVELSQPMAPGPLRRCIEFELFSNCVQPPTLFSDTLEFGQPFNLPGRAKHVFLKIPAGKYACITARDPLHTLRSSALLQTIENRYIAVFQGDPFFGGNWLIGGNLNGDRVIDAIDFGYFAQPPQDPLALDTPCGFMGPHADINGDGLVDQLDFDFIDRHQGDSDKGACCPTGTASPAIAPTMEITLEQLKAMGLGDLGSADQNHDGVLNQEDISIFRRGMHQTKTNRRRPR